MGATNFSSNKQEHTHNKIRRYYLLRDKIILKSKKKFRNRIH